MKVLIVILIVIAVIVLAMVFFMFYGMGGIRKLIINEVDLSKVADGTYNGSYHKGRWTYDLEVAIKGHKITSIKNLNKRMDMFKEINEKVEAVIIEKQTVKIDTVSGATINTKAFQKAVENTLTAAVGN